VYSFSDTSAPTRRCSASSTSARSSRWEARTNWPAAHASQKVRQLSAGVWRSTAGGFGPRPGLIAGRSTGEGAWAMTPAHTTTAVTASHTQRLPKMRDLSTMGSLLDPMREAEPLIRRFRLRQSYRL